MRAFKTKVPWPKVDIRRVSVNSFGYGGSNAHVVLDGANSLLQASAPTHISSYISDYDDIFGDEEELSSRPYVILLSANDEASLKAYCAAITRHVLNPAVRVTLRDLSYTLSERRSHHFYRAYTIAETTELDEGAFVFGKKSSVAPRIGFVFTGQGAQWPQMGKEIVENFPCAKPLLHRLDKALQSLPVPPKWSLLDELVEPRESEHLRRPEYSQPLVTALQLILIHILEDWGVRPQSVVGHSSGEIAAACASGLLTQEEAIKIAFLRGQAATDCLRESTTTLGMMAVGLGAEDVRPYLGSSEDAVQIACYNSPDSITLSGPVSELEKVRLRLTDAKHFARLLQVNLAYHSKYMAEIGKYYNNLLLATCEKPLPSTDNVTMFSSVTGGPMRRPADAEYWTDNMVSPVLFAQACREMVTGRHGADFLIELGPSGALAGPIAQIKKAIAGGGSNIQYHPAVNRGKDSIRALFNVAGQLYIAGGSINMSKVNEREGHNSATRPSVIVDLPNYAWNHSTKYWQESQSSKDWRFRQFPHHDLLGSKILGTSWDAPSWKNVLRLENVPWLMDHKMGSDILLPASGFISMAVEALYQMSQSTNPVEAVTSADQLCYRLRNVKFDKALILEQGVGVDVKLAMTAHPGRKRVWYDFRITSSRDDAETEHCTGLIRLEEPVKASE